MLSIIKRHILLIYLLITFPFIGFGQIEEILLNAEQRIPNSQQTIATLLKKSVDLHYKGHFSAAYQTAHQAKDYINPSTPQKVVGRIYLHMGNHALELNKFALALNHFKITARHYHLAQYDTGLASLYGNMAVVMERLGRTGKSLEYNYKSLEMGKRLGIDQRISNSYTNIGNAYIDMGKYNLAYAFFCKALELDSMLQSERMLSADYNNLGELYTKLQDSEKAIAFYQKSFNIDQKLNDLSGMCVTKTNIAKSYYELKKYQLAQELINEALQLGQKTGQIAQMITGYHLLSKIAEVNDDHKAALDNYKIYVQLQDSLDKNRDVAVILSSANEYLTQDNQSSVLEQTTQFKESKTTLDYLLKSLIFVSVIISVFIIYRLFLSPRANRL